MARTKQTRRRSDFRRPLCLTAKGVTRFVPGPGQINRGPRARCPKCGQFFGDYSSPYCSEECRVRPRGPRTEKGRERARKRAEAEAYRLANPDKPVRGRPRKKSE